MWEPSQATSDKDINGLVLLAFCGLPPFWRAHTLGDRVYPLWWKGYRPRVRPTWKPKGTKRLARKEKLRLSSAALAASSLTRGLIC